jgi:ubiquinone/menaquinone biosynthesis C-methylase UbiE
MDHFMKTMGLKGGERVIDLGGVAGFWKACPVPLDITIVNLPGSGLERNVDPRHTIRLIEADACNLHFVADNEFDLAFSNSVIEHVGPPEKQAALAREVRRVAPSYWVQTPSIWFPIEAHTYMPFWWFYPKSLKRYIMERWRKRIPARTRMVETTTVILRRDFSEMFPDGKIWTERFLGITKSYVAYRRGVI